MSNETRWLEINEGAPRFPDYVECVECGSLRFEPRLIARADGGLYCKEAEYCARAKLVRQEVLRLFEETAPTTLSARHDLSITLAEPTPEATDAHRKKWVAVRKARRLTKKKQAPRTCPGCGRDMSMARAHAKVCSRKCKNKMRKRTKE